MRPAPAKLLVVGQVVKGDGRMVAADHTVAFPARSLEVAEVVVQTIEIEKSLIQQLIRLHSYYDFDGFQRLQAAYYAGNHPQNSPR